MKKLLTFLCLGTCLSNVAFADVLERVRITGTRRIENDTVMNYLRWKKGDDVSSVDLDAATKTLFATGLFSDVQINMKEGVISIKVEENPIVHTIYFEGNHALDSQILKTEIMLKSRSVYTRKKLQDDALRLENVYKRNGRFGVKIDPKIIQKDQNRVDIVFEIDEGDKTTIQKINIRGNKAFSSDILRDVMISKEKAWYRFLASTDTYDPDRLNYDQELLRRYYLQNGYADFKVTNATAELTPDLGGFIITIDVNEGERYRFGDVALSVTLPEYQGKDKIEDFISFQSGDWFNADLVEDAVEKITETLENEGYAFVEVTPDIQKDDKNHTLSITYRVSEGPKVFIDKIQVNGNSRTLDKVIRREFRLKEGDAYNAARLRRSKQRIENLDYFSRVDLQTVPTDDPTKVNIRMDVDEKSTGAFNIGIGWSSYDGLLFETGIQERNVLGTGNTIGINAMFSQKETQYSVSLTDPYFLDKNLLAGLDVFHTNRDNSDSSSYSYTTTGGTARLGWDYTERLRQTVRYTLRQDDVNDIDSDASIYIKEQRGKTMVSLLGQELIYDRRDSRINPTQGFYGSIGTDFAGLGGDSKSFRINFTGIQYFSVTEDIIVSLRGDAGRIWGVSGQDVRINDRYFLGDASLRGFEYGGVGARDKSTDDALGGLWYATTSVEATFPIGLPKELGIKGKLFTDAGWIGRPENFDSATMSYSGKTRMAVGTGILWQSPMGMINLDFSYPIMKADEDKTRVFRLNFGKGF